MRDVPPEALRSERLVWATVDSPWLHAVDDDRFMRTGEPVGRRDPEVILSTRHPSMVQDTAACLEIPAGAALADVYVGPDQRALKEMLAGFEQTAVADPHAPR